MAHALTLHSAENMYNSLSAFIKDYRKYKAMSLGYNHNISEDDLKCDPSVIFSSRLETDTLNIVLE